MVALDLDGLAGQGLIRLDAGEYASWVIDAVRLIRAKRADRERHERERLKRQARG